ncbi:MmgE/PrpD family protein [Streptomyces xiaopingdaonensis]|uniref:MmgE/PrpD family protein n=1 Tax=Streptomyces xiaopingdaonensis TaxID=1565415 RepID=UPI0002FBB3DB|nr:MmgE/PrpD family protein [Streptomyces xiaopingdaonensis]
MTTGHDDQHPPPAPDFRAATAQRTAELGELCAELSWHRAPGEVRERLSLVLLDTLAVTLAGSRTDGQRRLRAAWPQPPGGAPVFGGDALTGTDAAAYLNATALVCSELDEGGKYARGHPAAHAFPAILALAAERGCTGELTARALLSGYEVAARFGCATALRPGAHPHGSWGVTGAAAGCAVLLGLPADRIAAAIDTAAGLPIAGHFDSAFDGHRVRDAWMGAAALSGLAAARLAAAGVVANTGTAALSLGTLLGTFDPDALARPPGGDWQIVHNYFKQHASCAYTHPAADLACELRRQHPEACDGGRVSRLVVDTHALAAPLDRTRWHNGLGAMFSVPYAVAAALLYGRITPETADATEATHPALFALARRVTVREDARMTARLPHERPARLTVHLDDGRRLEASAPHPLGDSDHHPFTARTLPPVLAELLGDRALVDRLHRLAEQLPEAADVGPALRSLTSARPTTPGGPA